MEAQDSPDPKREFKITNGKTIMQNDNHIIKCIIDKPIGVKNKKMIIIHNGINIYESSRSQSP